MGSCKVSTDCSASNFPCRHSIFMTLPVNHITHKCTHQAGRQKAAAYIPYSYWKYTVHHIRHETATTGWLYFMKSTVLQDPPPEATTVTLRYYSVQRFCANIYWYIHLHACHFPHKGLARVAFGMMWPQPVDWATDSLQQTLNGSLVGTNGHNKYPKSDASVFCFLLKRAAQYKAVIKIVFCALKASNRWITCYLKHVTSRGDMSHLHYSITQQRRRGSTFSTRTPLSRAHPGAGKGCC